MSRRGVLIKSVHTYGQSVPSHLPDDMLPPLKSSNIVASATEPNSPYIGTVPR